MVTETDEIIGRLRKEYSLDLTNVFDSDDLANSFNQLPTGKRPQAKNNLINNSDNFFQQSDTVQDTVVENAITGINESKTTKEINNIIDRIGAITSGRRNTIDRNIAVRERELLKEKTQAEITRQDIIESPRRRISKFSDDFGITEEEARDVVTREGFTLSEDGKTFKK